nr:hypothetical protein [Tanacetum cinerariifolium]
MNLTFLGTDFHLLVRVIMESSKTKLEKGKLEDAVSYVATRIQIKRDAEADPYSANSQVSMRRQTRELIQVGGLTNDKVKSHLQGQQSVIINFTLPHCKKMAEQHKLYPHSIEIWKPKILGT